MQFGKAAKILKSELFSVSGCWEGTDELQCNLRIQAAENMSCVGLVAPQHHPQTICNLDDVAG
jgi:hypothetical protein